MTTAGWTTGSLVAFLIARRWGYPLVRKLTSIERVKRMKRYIPEDLFWSVVFLRLMMPMVERTAREQIATTLERLKAVLEVDGAQQPPEPASAC